jgi:hypothetical protein
MAEMPWGREKCRRAMVNVAVVFARGFSMIGRSPMRTPEAPCRRPRSSPSCARTAPG